MKTTYKFYTGVGSRETPNHIHKMMWEIATFLYADGFTLRSGKARGADSAFESGAGNNTQIFLAKDCTDESMAIAASLWKPEFPVPFHRMKEFGKLLHGRNPFQVLGPRLNPADKSKFLICWTKDGCKTHVQRTVNTGGTGTAISVASLHNVPVYNLGNAEDYNYWDWWLSEKRTGNFKLHTIYTSHYRYSGDDRADITFKGQDRNGFVFAPTKEMVHGVKYNGLPEKQYENSYWKIISKIGDNHWRWLFSLPERTLVCFCRQDEFCHRNILANSILLRHPTVSWGGWKQAV